MLFGAGAPGAAHGTPSRDVQHLWLSLARRRWSSLVLVPVDPDFSAAAIATSLADVGSRLRDSPVTAILADSMDYESARILADLQLRARDEREVPLPPPPRAHEPVEVEVVGYPAQAAPEHPGAASGAAGAVHEARLVRSSGQVVVAIQPVMVEPLGVAIAHAADAVVLCIQVGKTQLASARRTVDLIGADRVTGAFLVS